MARQIDFLHYFIKKSLRKSSFDLLKINTKN